MAKQRLISNYEVEESIKEFVEHFVTEKRELKAHQIAYQIDPEQLNEVEEIFKIGQEAKPIDIVVKKMMQSVFKNNTHLSHPRFFGFVPSNASTLSWLGDIMTTAYNLHMGSQATSPMAYEVEEQILSWLCDKVGFEGHHRGGLFVSGGSMANMTGLIAARDKHLDPKDFNRGVAYVSDQTHSSVAKALRLIGINPENVRSIATDDEFKMDISLLKENIENDLKNDLKPFCIIGSTGTTNTGSIDPLNEIADLCEKYKLWFHIDGAYGASAILSEKHKHLLAGIDRCDSLSWDAHKWLFQTYGCAMCLVQNTNDLIKSFHTHPEYLDDIEAPLGQINQWDLGMEMTRPARGIKLWLTLQVLGEKFFVEAVEHGFQLSAWAYDELLKKKHWEIVSKPSLAILNFRFAPEDLSASECDQLNQKVSQKMIKNGFAGVFTTILKGKKVLRICSINPETSEADIRNTIKILNDYANEIYSEMKA